MGLSPRQVVLRLRVVSFLLSALLVAELALPWARVSVKKAFFLSSDDLYAEVGLVRCLRGPLCDMYASLEKSTVQPTGWAAKAPWAKKIVDDSVDDSAIAQASKAALAALAVAAASLLGAELVPCLLSRTSARRLDARILLVVTACVCFPLSAVLYYLFVRSALVSSMAGIHSTPAAGLFLLGICVFFVAELDPYAVDADDVRVRHADAEAGMPALTPKGSVGAGAFFNGNANGNGNGSYGALAKVPPPTE